MMCCLHLYLQDETSVAIIMTCIIHVIMDVGLYACALCRGLARYIYNFTPIACVTVLQVKHL